MKKLLLIFLFVPSICFGMKAIDWEDTGFETLTRHNKELAGITKAYHLVIQTFENSMPKENVERLAKELGFLEETRKRLESELPDLKQTILNAEIGKFAWFFASKNSKHLPQEPRIIFFSTRKTKQAVLDGSQTAKARKLIQRLMNEQYGIKGK